MDRGVTLAHLAWGRAGARPDGVAYVHVRDGDEDEQELSWADLDRRARAVAARLTQVAERAGQDPVGSRALLLFPHGLEFPAALLGCFYARVVAVPTNPPAPRKPLERTAAIARDAGLSFVLTTRELLAEREDIVRRASELGRVPWIAVDALFDDAAHEELSREAVTLPDPDDLAFLQYTSGSTGTPRGVMVSHANALHNAERLRLSLHVEEDSVIVSWLPFHHDMGLVGILLSTLYRGPRCVLLSPTHFLEKPLRWLEAVTRHRGTMTGAPDFAFELCARRVEADPSLLKRLDLSSLGRCFSGSEPIRAATLERFARTFAPAGLRAEVLAPGYGLAEATLAVSCGTVPGAPRVFALDRRALDAGRAVPADASAPESTEDAGHLRRLVGCGPPIPGVEVAIVDPETRLRRPAGVAGEVWVRGASNAVGYWRNPEATRETFQARITGEERTGERPWLRTGDLGLFHEGELCLCGRLKDLVIVRGENHYPQDVERAAGDAHDALRPGGGAAFAAEPLEPEGSERLVLVHELRRPRGVDHEAVFAAVTRAVAEAEGLELDTIVLIPPGALPKTTSGKVRRRRTRHAWEEGTLQVLARWERPRLDVPASRSLAPEPQAVTGWLAERAGALRGAPLDADDLRRPLAGLGLDSLSVTELFHALSDALGAAPPLARLFEGASVADVAREACAARAAGELVSVPEANAAPLDPAALTHGQRALWFLQRLAPRDPAYHLATALAVLSPTRPDELRRALEALVRRHAALRTTFHENEAGEPRRRVHETLAIDFRVQDARALDEPALRRAAAEAARAPFDLEHGPLLRVRWFEREGQPDVCALVTHHIALDHWSFATLFEELALLHDGRELAPLAVDGEAFLAWQQACEAEGRWDAAWDYWRAKLAALPEPLALGAGPGNEASTDEPGHEHDAGRAGESHVVSLPRELGQTLSVFAAARGLTPSVVALAAFEALLARLGGSEDFLLATLHAGRGEARFASLVGYLVNTLVLRADLSGAPSFERLLERTRADLAASLAHAELPFAHLVERLHPEREADGTTLVRTLFTWQNPLSRGGADLSSFALGVDGERVGLGGLVVRPLALDLGSAQFDLSLTMGLVAGAPVIALEVDRRRLGSGTARRLARAYEHLLRAALARPERRLRDHVLVGEDERARLLELARGPAPAPTPWPAASVGARFLSAVRAHGARPALLAQGAAGGPGGSGDEPWSFDELARRVARMARALARRGVGPGCWVGLELPRSRAQAVALFATLCRGAAWLPIDPALPERRRAALRARAALVLDAAEVHALLAADDTEDAEVADGDGGAEVLARELASPAPLDPAYALFTSGSSGEPKGVVVPQRALAVHVAAAAAHFALGPEDRVLHMAAIGFDLSIEELLPALLEGASVVVREPAAPPSIDELEELVRAHAIGVLDLPTVYWHEWMRVVEDERRALPAGLRLVIVGGERASSRALATWRSVAPASLRWVNTYGPTEATVTTTLFDACEAHRGAIPIGRPVAGQRVLVLDAAGLPVAPGAPGELAIGGACLANGYLGLPARTAASFVPDPLAVEPGARVYLTGDLVRFDEEGRLVFLGRRDAQVKIRGVRIEPGEVEAALAAHPAVGEACVLACPAPNGPGDPGGPGGPQRLAAWYVPLQELAPEALAAHLAERLPAALVPAVLLARDSLPRNAHGKLDRATLLGELAALEREGLGSRTLTPLASGETPRAAGDAAPDVANDASALALRLADHWSALLHRPVAPHDDFFALGGDSIQSIQAAARAAREGIVFTPADLFRHPTPAALARVARRERVGVAPDAKPHVGPLPLSPVQRWFFGLGLSEPAHWNFSLAFELEPVAEPARLATALVALARRHEALRLRFRRDPATDEGWSAFVVEPDAADVPLEVHTLASAAEEEALVAAHQASLDLERAPCRALFVRRAARARLVLCVHHLLVDAVSWRVLGEELSSLLRGADPGPAPLPWHRFVAGATEPAETVDPTEAALRAWLERFARVEQLPRDDEGGTSDEEAAVRVDAGCASSEASLETVLAPERRRALQQLALRSRVTLEELLASAVCLALAEWSGARTLALELEGHGRDGLPPAAGDASRTVGWFTELTPLVLEIEPGVEPLTLLRRLKQELATLPGGRGAWFRARYGPHAARRARLALPREPEVSLNLLGELDGLERSQGLRLVTPPPPAQRSPRDARTRLFEIDAWGLAGALHVRWSYACDRHDRATVEGLLAATTGWLTRLAQAGDPGRALSAADFPHAGLDDLDLGKVLTQLRPTP